MSMDFDSTTISYIHIIIFLKTKVSFFKFFLYNKNKIVSITVVKTIWTDVYVIKSVSDLCQNRIKLFRMNHITLLSYL